MPNRMGEPGHSVVILVHEPGSYLAAVWCNVCLVYWMKQGTVQAVANVRASLEAVYAKSPEQTFSTIHLIRDGAGIPEADVRHAVLAMSSHLAPRTACLAVVLMGAGFWASALQSILTALRMLAPQRSGMMRFSREPAELCAWFPAEHNHRTQSQVDSQGLSVAIDRIFTISKEARTPG